MKVIDVHGFGGGFTLGAVQVGFELEAKFSREVGFGVFNTLGNRHMLPGPWESIAGLPSTWEVRDADVIIGNPPCSGFSTLTSSKKAKGDDAAVNDYMWELIHYAARVKPRIVMWESVQQTFRQGLGLMRRLHDTLEAESGKLYDLYHVLHNNASLGGVSIRRRYFWVAVEHGLPYGVESCVVLPDGTTRQLDRVPTFGDMLRDLEPLAMTLAEQPYRGVTCKCQDNTRLLVRDTLQCRCAQHGNINVAGASWWTREQIHDGTGAVDGHSTFYSPSLRRMLDLMYQPELNEQGVPWEEGERLADVLVKYYARHGNLPPSWRYPTTEPDPDHPGEIRKTTKDVRLISTKFNLGHHQQVRWRADRMAKVVTGGAVHSVIHPHLPRTLTQREVARVQGFPDAWKIWPVRNAPDLGPGWGKGVPVQAGRWGALWAKQALLEQPGSITGRPLAEHDRKLAEKFGLRERERVIDVTNDYKPFTAAIGDPG